MGDQILPFDIPTSATTIHLNPSPPSYFLFSISSHAIKYLKILKKEWDSENMSGMWNNKNKMKDGQKKKSVEVQLEGRGAELGSETRIEINERRWIKNNESCS